MNENIMNAGNIDQDGLNRYIAKVFGWMFLGLMVTAATTAFFIIGSMHSEFIFNLTVMTLNLIFPITIGQFILVFYLSMKIQKMNPVSAKLIYLIYAILNGITVGLLSMMVFPGNAVPIAFMLTSVSFGVMSLYGLVTKSDLTKMGNILGMALFGLIIIMVFNLFMRSSQLDFMVSIAGLFIFLGLTVHDTKQIKQYYYNLGQNTDSDLAENIAIIGALKLYLDFINIFMFFLRLLSRNSRN